MSGALSAILCRNNAPILQLALQFIAMRKPMRVLGDFSETLENFINKFRASDIKTFKQLLQKWFDKEAAECELKEQWGKLARARDKYECVMVLTQGHETVDEMLLTLSRIFEPGVGPILSSIHRAKGMEADRVWILRPDLMPSKYAKSPEQQQQERNLAYVAYTRARKELNFIAVEE